MRLQGKVAIVTGAAHGMGESEAVIFAREGASVVVADVDADGQKVAANITGAGGRAQFVKLDVASEADWEAAIKSTVGAYGRLDILVNTAGITIDKTVLKLSDEDWFKVINVNLSGAFFLSQAALRHMAERGSGRIVNVSSVIGEMGNIGQANYAASKSGLFGLTKTLAREAAFLLAKAGRLGDPDGVGLTVNTVTPGFIATEMLEHIPAKLLEKIVGQIPLGRLGKPEEIARVVHFLAADASSYITGQVWGVNGGLDM